MEIRFSISWLWSFLPLLVLLLSPTAIVLLTSSPRPPDSTPSATTASSVQLRQHITKPESVSTAGALLPDATLPSLLRRNFPAKSTSAVERDLAGARAAIRKAISRGNATSQIPPHVDSVDVYRNRAAFFQSYYEMEKRFRVYVYEEGEAPLVHDGPCKDIYATEGRFIHELEMMGPGPPGTSGLRTWDPTRAHAFFLPFSVSMIVEFVYDPATRDRKPVRRFVSDFVGVVSTRHPFWNRTAGADHFMLSCHDWGPYASQATPELHTKSILALCNANTSEGFNPGKDVSIPEINLYTGDIAMRLRSPPPASSPRPYLAFFAGGVHGPIRPLLLQHWRHPADPDMHVYEYLPTMIAGSDTEDDQYFKFMLQSKFCLCPSGYEVASPRVVEAIYAECVPVIISVGYVPPFSDVLKWEEFSVSVNVSDIPRLKEVLGRVSDDKVERLRKGLRAVRQHFILNRPAERFDAFHMMMHSVWLRRINLNLG